MNWHFGSVTISTLNACYTILAYSCSSVYCFVTADVIGNQKSKMFPAHPPTPDSLPFLSYLTFLHVMWPVALSINNSYFAQKENTPMCKRSQMGTRLHWACHEPLNCVTHRQSEPWQSNQTARFFHEPCHPYIYVLAQVFSICPFLPFVLCQCESTELPVLWSACFSTFLLKSCAPDNPTTHTCTF